LTLITRSAVNTSMGLSLPLDSGAELPITPPT
jgi:hypothetical protein